MNKKSQSHVEILLSFILFMGVVLILFFYANPLSKTSSKIPEILNIKKKILENTSEEVIKISVKVGNSSSCYNISEIKKDYGSNFVEIKKNNLLYTLYFSSVFPSSSPSCGNYYNYTLAPPIKEKIPIYERIKSLKNLYENDYQSLKKSLGISSDFSFAFKNINKTKIDVLSVEKTPPAGVEVYSKEFPLIIMNSSGNIKEVILNIKVW